MKAYELASLGLDQALLGCSSNIVKMVSPAVEKQVWENNQKTDKFSHYAFQVVIENNQYAKIQVACERPNAEVLKLRHEDLGAKGMDVELVGLQVSINFKNEVYARCTDVVIVDQDANIVKKMMEDLG
ncbi:TPA: hypothetical protein TZ704_002107 [Streptococcus suis]|nr:hypothetical protein [Streptococcus suis]